MYGHRENKRTLAVVFATVPLPLLQNVVQESPALPFCFKKQLWGSANSPVAAKCRFGEARTAFLLQNAGLVSQILPQSCNLQQIRDPQTHQLDILKQEPEKPDPGAANCNSGGGGEALSPCRITGLWRVLHIFKRVEKSA
jgi:hypothetical protein